MKREAKQPEKVREDAHSVVSAHPAFGNVTVAQWHSSGAGHRMCGSDLLHNTGLTITFRAAEHHRGLSNDRWAGREVLLEVDLSQAQWARFVSSQGNGDGLPCTITARRLGPIETTPEIAAPEASKLEKFGAEMAEGLRGHLSAISERIAHLGAMIDEGRISKKELREIHRELARHAEQLPGNAKFVHDQFARSTEKMAHDAMVEVEGFVLGMAQRLGLQQLADMAPKLIEPDAAAKK